MTYASILNSTFPSARGTNPQTEALHNQVRNNAGGYCYEIDDWQMLDRFLILGTDQGTYYVSAVKLTQDNATVVKRLLSVDGLRVVNRIVEISDAGRAHKNDPALLALAIATTATDLNVRKAAYSALNKVARTGTHLLMFVSFVNHIKGWSRGLRKAVSNWFIEMPIDKLALQIIKYNQREGWALRDVLRLCHINPTKLDDQKKNLLEYIIKQEFKEGELKALPTIFAAYLVLKKTDIKEAPQLVSEHNLPREAIPTEFLNDVEIWRALLDKMTTTAMIRNLGKMGSIELLKPFSESAKHVVSQLINAEHLKKARIHPIQIVLALKTYARGAGILGSLKWTPLPSIIEALHQAFDLSCQTVEAPTNRRILIGIDISGSMTAPCEGSPILMSSEAAIAVALMFVRTEPCTHTIAFDTNYKEFPISKTQRLDDALKNTNTRGGGTDISQPIKYALDKRLEVDVFVVLTDNETWTGKMHPVQALHKYRNQINPRAKLIVLAAAANNVSVCEPEDKLSLGIAGFDASVVAVANEFIKAEI